MPDSPREKLPNRSQTDPAYTTRAASNNGEIRGGKIREKRRLSCKKAGTLANIIILVVFAVAGNYSSRAWQRIQNKKESILTREWLRYERRVHVNSIYISYFFLIMQYL